MSDVQKINMDRLGLYSQLFLYGDYMPMRFWIDPKQVGRELEAFKDKWIPYNIQRGDTGRVGLSVTSLDGGMSGYPDLQSLYQYSQETGGLLQSGAGTQPLCEIQGGGIFSASSRSIGKLRCSGLFSYFRPADQHRHEQPSFYL
jgi:hypothetical protein